MVGLSRADARDTRARWWFSGFVVWWFSCLVVWLFSGLVVWLFGYLVGLVVWWFLHWGEVVEPSGWLMERLHLTKQPNN